MGHANIQTSMIYDHPSTTNLREAAEQVAATGFGHSAVTRKTGARA